MAVYIGQASCDENGKYVGGQAGNWSGTELNTRAFYNKLGFGPIRFKNGATAVKCATAMQTAVGNMKIGYDQGERNTILSLAKATGWDVGAIREACGCDCFSIAGVCGIAASGGAIYSTIYSGGNLCYAGNIVSRFKTTGLVDAYDSSYAASSGSLQNGDILASSSPRLSW